MSFEITATSLDDRVTKLLKQTGLSRPENAFFEKAHGVKRVTPAVALEIATGWHRMTRTFMLTTLESLGVMAEALMDSDVETPRSVLGAYQTAHQVIGDDLSNLAPDFAAVAPKGPDGIHYVWWDDTIITPLRERVNGSLDASSAGGSPGIDALIDNMRRLGKSHLGAAVELRVVESIALDIALAFRKLYGRVELDGEWLFRAPHALDWVDSHIKAETSHASSVSDDEVGMTTMVMPGEEEEFMALAGEYAASWAAGLDDFASRLD